MRRTTRLFLLALAGAASAVALPGSVSALRSSTLVGGYGPGWSPDGTEVAFIGPARRWVVSPKTSTLTETAGTNRVIVVSARGTMPPHIVSIGPPGQVLDEVRWADGGRFVYQDSNYTLWADTGTRGRGATRLATVGISGGDSFTLSADRRLVAFTAPCGCGVAQGTEVGVVAAAGGKVRILPHPANAIETHPSFWPNGRSLIFSRTLVGKDETGGTSLVVQALGGRSARSLRVRGDWPAFSPDGRWIAFESMSPARPGALEVMPAAGGAPRLLVEKPRGAVVGPFSWSPDSTRLVFEDGTRIGIVDLDGRRSMFPLRGLRPGLGTPQWSPDGSSIAFTAIELRSDLDSRVYLIDADGTRLRRIG